MRGMPWQKCQGQFWHSPHHRGSFQWSCYPVNAGRIGKTASDKEKALQHNILLCKRQDKNGSALHRLSLSLVQHHRIEFRNRLCVCVVCWYSSKGCFHGPSILDLQKGVCYAAADNHRVDLQPLHHPACGDVKRCCYPE